MLKRACIYCGCTENHACEVAIDQIADPEIRAAIDRAQARFVEALTVIGCWWISEDPPVCSAPACVRRAAAELHTASSDDPHAARRATTA